MMLRNTIALTFLAVFISGCNSADAVDTRRLMVVDTHIDLPYRLDRNYENVAELTAHGDFDYARARMGGLNTAFMSIYVPVEKQEPGVARDFADHLIDLVEATTARYDDKFVIVRSTWEVVRASRSGQVAFALGIENGAAIEGDLGNVWHFHSRGVRYITLAHAKSNLIADSSYDSERPWGGLSDFGVRVVQEMNRVGVIVDVSHISDEAVLDVLDNSRAPVLATHSSARHFTPGFERNLSDELIRKIADAGGVIQINFGSAFLTQDANQWYLRYDEDAAAYRKERALGRFEPIPEFDAEYRASNPLPFATVDDVLDHIDYIVALVGVDHVGFGSDFDGVGDSLPIGLKSVADYPVLIQGLRDRGYTEEDVVKIAGRNTLRVWAAVEQRARLTQLVDRERDPARVYSYHR